MFYRRPRKKNGKNSKNYIASRRSNRGNGYFSLFLFRFLQLPMITTTADLESPAITDWGFSLWQTRTRRCKHKSFTELRCANGRTCAASTAAANGIARKRSVREEAMPIAMADRRRAEPSPRPARLSPCMAAPPRTAMCRVPQRS